MTALQQILENLFDCADVGWEKGGALEEAETALCNLVSETISKPIHEAARKAGDIDTANVATSDYYTGVWNALYWALSKIDGPFRIDEEDRCPTGK